MAVEGLPGGCGVAFWLPWSGCVVAVQLLCSSCPQDI